MRPTNASHAQAAKMHGYANNTAASTMHYSYMPLGSLHTLHTKLIIQKKVSDKCRFPVAMSYMLFPII